MSKEDTVTINVGKIKKPLKNFQKALSKNYWVASTIILAIALVFVIVNGSIFESSISAEEAGQKVIDFANAQGANAELIKSSDNGQLFEVLLSIQGQQVPVYVTKDGENLITTLIPLNRTVGTPTNPTNIEITIESNDPVAGDQNAQVSIIEFSDFQCPFCERAYSTSVADLKNSDAFKNGEINFIYKHFPLNSIHPLAQKAAEASVCAQNQGKFWEYHDKLFENQQALEIANLKSYATQLGLNTAQFNTCLDSGASKDKVARDLEAATTAGGTGTPYFIIYNKENKKTASLSGAVPYAQIEAAVESVKVE